MYDHCLLDTNNILAKLKYDLEAINGFTEDLPLVIPEMAVFQNSRILTRNA